jgi:hypothetical protein
MRSEAGVIEGTAQEVMAELARIPANQPVRAFVGHPSLTIIARQLQAVAAANGMTQDIHDELIRASTGVPGGR